MDGEIFPRPTWVNKRDHEEANYFKDAMYHPRSFDPPKEWLLPPMNMQTKPVNDLKNEPPNEPNEPQKVSQSPPTQDEMLKITLEGNEINCRASRM